MNVDDKIRRVLQLIDKGSFDERNSLPDLSREELKRIVLMCQDEGFIVHNSNKQKLVTEHLEGFTVNPSTQLTRKGNQFLEGNDRNSSQSSQSFTINGNVANAMLGNDNTQINYNSDAIFEDLKNYIEDNITDENDREEGKKLVKELETKEIEPGYLSRFEDLLKKYPNIAKFVSSILVGFALGS